MGAGRSGLFHGTKGSKGVPPIIQRKNLRYNKNKTEDYLLNPNHPKGGAKAKFFIETLGYSKSSGEKFHNAVYQSIKGKILVRTENTHYGIKHIYHTKIRGANGKYHEANVVVVIQKDNKRITYKIVTVYPNKK